MLFLPHIQPLKGLQWISKLIFHEEEFIVAGFHTVNQLYNCLCCKVLLKYKVVLFKLESMHLFISYDDRVRQ